MRDVVEPPGQRPGITLGPAAITGFFIVVAILGALFVSVAERGLTPSLWSWLMPTADNGRKVTSVFPGVISHDFHQKEALYNQYLQQVERQRQRGWQVQKGWLGRSQSMNRRCFEWPCAPAKANP